MTLGVIPARFASTRLPGKPLVDLNGKPMIQWVWEAARTARQIDRLVVATDNDLIADVVRGFGGDAVMTDPTLPSGTDRCAAATQILGIDADIVLNIQGDEPLIPGELLDDLILTVKRGDCDVATPVARITDAADLSDPGIVTVAAGADGRVLYFSRSPIPHMRGKAMSEWLQLYPYWKHIGLYAYTAEALQRHINLPVSALEEAEALEQLRLLEDGARFHCVLTEAKLVAVDTPADAERVRALL